MWVVRLFCLLFVLVLVRIDIGRAGDDCQPEGVAYTLTVDLNGGGNFTKVQHAVNYIQAGNVQWKRILISAGTYKEQVIIPRGLLCVVLQGAGLTETTIEWNAHSATDSSATFATSAVNFVARDMSFKNTYNYDLIKETDGKQRAPALAVAVYGDKSAFYNCGFYGLQDTLWDVRGRHYFHSCHIEGAVDFIWGGGQSMYENCEINVLSLGKGLYGYITAQDRQLASDHNGFVFKGGKVTGSGSADLGRAYGPYSRVLFYGTYFSNVVRSVGWYSWNQKDEQNIVFAEDACTGPGANTSGRVSWLKKLPEAEIKQLINAATFIDQDSWLSKQPSSS